MEVLFKILTTFVILILSTSSCFSMETVFYVLHNRTGTHQTPPTTLSDITHHAASINILLSQAYRIDKNGKVAGFINPDILDAATQHSIKLMAMITNAGFDKEQSHKFLSNHTAQTQALNTILTICKQNHLYGIQFDFETIALGDKNALTQFYQSAADLLHKNKLVVSFAIEPTVSDAPFSSEYIRRWYLRLAGAYDLTALGKMADFITLMAYDQHIGRVTPGPTASIDWVDAVIKHTLKFVPANKISLGIPAYSGVWYTGVSSNKEITTQNDSISYADALGILKRNNGHLQWDDVNKENYAFFQRNWLNEFIYLEDARSLKFKLDLVKKYHLRGISFFRIGIEDPNAWNVI